MTSGNHELLQQLEPLGDISIVVRAEIDQTTFTLSDLLSLEPGSLLPLSRPTGENIDLYAEEVLIGWGEVLLMDGSFAVRIANLRDVGQSGSPALD